MASLNLTISSAIPFKIRGFRTDNGSEYINYSVAELLEKMRVTFTKSRPRHSDDNGLADSKNGTVIGKLYGYSHIPQCYADEFAELNSGSLYRYVKFTAPAISRQQ